MSTANSPTPTFPHVRRTSDSADFFDAAREGRLLLRRCDACGTIRGPQVRWCPQCHAAAHQPQFAAGCGRLVSWAVVHRPPHPMLEADAPYVAGLVELDEGPWVPVRVVRDPDQELRVGTPVRVLTSASADDGEAVVFAEVVAGAGGGR